MLYEWESPPFHRGGHVPPGIMRTMAYLYDGGGGGGRTVPVRARRVDGVLPGERGGRGGRARLSEPRQRDLAPLRLARDRQRRNVGETRSGGGGGGGGERGRTRE